MTIIGRGYSFLAKAEALAREDRIDHSLTVAQLRMDSTLHSFASGASDPNMLASMMMGGLAGRCLKLGFLSSPTSFLARPLAQTVALLGEATAFEATNRGLQVARGQAPSEILQWEGEHGFARGIFHSVISFAALNAAGHFARDAHLFLQHAAQSSAFVISHEVASFLHLQAPDERDWATRMIEAELMNLQLGLSKSLLNTALPSLALFERSADIQNAMRARPLSARASLEGKSFFLQRMSSSNPAREIVVSDEINSANFDRILSLVRSSKGFSLTFSPQTFPVRERYAPLVRLWFALQPHASEYAGLRIQLEGLCFRYGEFPGEMNERSLEDLGATLLTPRMGTLIEVDPVRGDFEEIHAVLQAVYQAYTSTTVKHPTDRSTTIRTVYPESIASQLRSGIYGHYSEMRVWLHATSREISEMNETLTRGASFSEAQRARLEEIKAVEKRWMNEFLAYKHLWDWMEANKVKSAREEILEGPSVRQVLHDLNNRLSALMTVNADISLMESGVVLEAKLLHATETSTHLTVASAVNEAIGMALAIANQMGIKLSSLSGISHRFQHVLLTEDSHVEFALMDVMGNLLSNAFRYSDPAKGVEAQKPKMTVHFLREGDLELTVFDQGIGILPENFDRLGESGFRETRKEIEGSSGHGISSVIQILRERGWGPLWVRSIPGTGSAFRFVIPKSDFEKAEEFQPDLLTDEDTLRPPDPRSYVERNLQEGFLVPAASLDMAIPHLLREIPPDLHVLHSGAPHIQDILTGTFQHRRLLALHRLLSGAHGPQNVTAVDNAYGSNPNVFLELSRMGTRVWLKEPDPEMDAMQFINRDELTPEMRDLLQMTDASTLDAALPVPARIVYWSNPSYANFVLPSGRTLQEYLSRDVGVGGYLVIQNGRGPFERDTRNFNFDPLQWQLVYQSEPVTDPRRVMDERILSTTSSIPNVIFIYRRIR